MPDTPNNETFKEQANFTYKRCPYCYTHLKLNAEHCIECRKKVGEVDKVGLAKKPFNYKAYLAAGLWVVLLSFYVWKLLYVKIIEFLAQ